MTLRLALTAAVAASAVISASAAPQTQTLQGASLRLEDLVSADVTINVVPGTQGVQVTLDGRDEAVARTTMATEGQDAVIRMAPRNVEGTFSGYDIKLTVTVAPGTPLAIGGFIGRAAIGDLDAPLSLEATAGEVKAGRLTTASLESSGSMDVEIASVEGALSFSSSGSGSLKAGAVGLTAIEIDGSGSADIASVAGGLNIEIAGSADLTIGTIDGPTQIDIAGSGSVEIKGGRATSFEVSAAGSGEVKFGGTAVNPKVDAAGSGDVCIDTIEGSLDASGSDVRVGKGACS